ncbi:type VI secretion system lipoprotein TssJ [Commensalibacter nepenthis]|uniref:Type VI secretion system lipoprotein TssJ n=1 Tax=Commensalibacter nepenthis TaxID=3043872 RepID=A0ABT6Q5Y5_9PROT|nr:type VI secretion system lipoprotein TssJ [Commensalibacter sp. TBRC 10068]MDI2111750.1 type VI secretion system lipoprotein TssJ [Commensalibacter sp. TBRC 10068]
MYINKQKLLGLGVCLLILSGCSSSKKDVQQASVNEPKKARHIKELYLQFNTDKELNLNQDKQPLSVMVRIYQFKDNQAFLQSNYKELLKEKNNDIKQNTLNQYDIILKPNEKILLHRPLEKDSIYIAIVAFFRNPDLEKNNWKIIIRRDYLFKKKPRIIEISSNKLSLEPTKKELKAQGKK